MTNKVKPFYIRITDNMTPQMVQDAFDKCVDAGAIACEGVECTRKKHEYKVCYDINFNNFGVNKHNKTLLHDGSRPFGGPKQEITLDQLDEWLRLEVEQGWQSGDECQYNCMHWLFCGFHPVNGLAIVSNNDNPHIHQLITVDVNLLSKPEKPEQKAERERLEAVKQMWVDCGYRHSRFNINGLEIEKTKKDLFALYDAGYRKQ